MRPCLVTAEAKVSGLVRWAQPPFGERMCCARAMCKPDATVCNSSWKCLRSALAIGNRRLQPRQLPVFSMQIPCQPACFSIIRQKRLTLLPNRFRLVSPVTLIYPMNRRPILKFATYFRYFPYRPQSGSVTDSVAPIRRNCCQPDNHSARLVYLTALAPGHRPLILCPESLKTGMRLKILELLLDGTPVELCPLHDGRAQTGLIFDGVKGNRLAR